MSTVSERPRDCTACKLVSGCGLMGIGAYVSFHSRKFGGFSRVTMVGISCAFVYLGAARLLDLPPFPLGKAIESDKMR